MSHETRVKGAIGALPDIVLVEWSEEIEPERNIIYWMKIPIDDSPDKVQFRVWTGKDWYLYESINLEEGIDHEIAL